MREGDDHVLLGDEVLDVEVHGRVRYLCATLVAKLLGDLLHLGLDDLEDLPLVRKESLVVLDGLAQAVELVLDLVALQAGQAAQAHLEDRRRLDLGEPKPVDEPLGRLRVRAAGTDDGDDLVDVVERKQQALEDVRAGARLRKVELRASGNHVDLVVDVVLKHLAQRERPRHAVDQRKVDDAEGALQRGVLVQVVQDDLGHRTLLQHEHKAQTLAIRLVAHVGDAVDALLVYQGRDLLLKGALVHAVRELGEH